MAVQSVLSPANSSHEDSIIARMDGAASRLAGWGRHPVVEGYESLAEDLETITSNVVLSRGLGRSYGDSSLPPPGGHRVAGSVLADRILAFDDVSGLVRVEAGFPLWRLNRLFLTRNWFTPVTPGTHFVTVGGMTAADVHGKNHHSSGCFGAHVYEIRMRLADGSLIDCSPEKEAELFRATIGGMGLTGHILEVAFRMQRISSPWIWQESERTDTFEATLERLQEAGKDWPYTVCWADFLGRGRGAGRGVLQRGRWAEPHEAPARPPKFHAPVTLPPVVPSWFLQPWMVRLFNRFYFTAHGAKIKRGIIHPETFFYPLDVVREWNRLYGPRGFTQYQCVLPMDNPGCQRQFLDLLYRHSAPVFLCVIKDCGPEGVGMISYPKPGISYALDIPMGKKTQALVDALNELVISEGGRIYLAKDALTRRDHFRAMEPRLDAWLAVRRAWDPQRRLRSAQSLRLLGDTQ
jgi:decaprenylphospho-beta-D-ribofuranose 2-oxidase